MYFVILYQIRRKFRSQTSDNMDRWKSRGGKSQGREAKEKEVQRRERVRRKKMQVGEKVEKSWNTVFSIISGSGGSKSRLAKAADAEPSGQMRDEKLHAHVARSTSPSQNVQNSKVCAKVLSRLWSCSGQVSVSRIPIETRRTTKDDEE